MTQHEKVIAMHLDWKWHCQNEYRDNYIFSPHKRRVEIEGRKNRKEPPTGKYIFTTRRCEHGIHGQYDYLMSENPDYIPVIAPTKKQAKKTDTDILSSPKNIQMYVQ